RLRSTVHFHFFYSRLPPHPTPPLFPYTTLFRSTRIIWPSLAAVVVLPVPFTPTIETTVGPSAARLNLPLFEARLLSTCFAANNRSEEHTSELQSLAYLVCRLLLEKKKSDP